MNWFPNTGVVKMDERTAEIIICMGSSCFSRGNRKALPMIQEFLKERGLSGRVVFRGAHCFGKCENGPVLSINGVEYRQVDLNRLQGILEQVFVQA
jgi:NADH:ubiquinone oxidoreductase subunit E